MTLKIGIIGTGSIANIIAKSLTMLDNISIKAVYSRAKKTALEFAINHNIDESYAYCDLEQFFSTSGIDAVYIATPTTTKDYFCLQAIKNSKHILVEKPFSSHQVLQTILHFSQKNNLVLLDATHFPHNPRSTLIVKTLNSSIGQLHHIRANFCFPRQDKEASCFDSTLEPYGVLGDLGWYPLRAALHFLPKDTPSLNLKGNLAAFKRANHTITQASGLVKLSNQMSLNFDISYDSTTVSQTIEFIGEKATLVIDDYVLPWDNSFVYGKKNNLNKFHLVDGYHPKNSKQTRKVYDNGLSQHQKMIMYFARLIKDELPHERFLKKLQIDMLNTSKLMDTLWHDYNRSQQ